MPWISISPSSHQLHPLLSHEELLSLFQVAASCLGSPTVSLKTGPSVLPSSNPEQVILPSDSYFFQKLLLFFCFIVLLFLLFSIPEIHKALPWHIATLPLSLRVPLYLFFLDVQTLCFIYFNCSCLLQRAVSLDNQYVREGGFHYLAPKVSREGP